jgi:hypothetical protein
MRRSLLRPSFFLLILEGFGDTYLQKLIKSSLLGWILSISGANARKSSNQGLWD